MVFDPYPLVSDRVVELATWLDEPNDAASDDEVEARLASATADDLASIIYTSGTTGEPRGAAPRHRGFSYQCDVLAQFFDVTPEDHSLCFLPLSHALERAWTFFVFDNCLLYTSRCV